MRIKRFMKMFFLAMGIQAFLLFVISPILSRLISKGTVLPAFLLGYVYEPFIRMVVFLGQFKGEAAMIWPPVYGVVAGTLVYSTVFAVMVTAVIRTGRR